MGWISEINLFWLVPAALLAYGLSYLYYRRKSVLAEFSRRLCYLLTFLRGSVLLILILLLLGIILEHAKDRKEAPIILTLIDDSQSMLNYADSGRVAKKIEGLLFSLESELSGKTEQLSLDLSLQPLDSLNFTRPQSNIDAAISGVADQYGNRNIGAVVLVSDGNFNRGRNPIYVTDRLGFTPLYTLGVGDSVQKKDVLISSVSYNDIAFLGNRFPILVSVEAFKAPKVNLTIEVLHKGRSVAQRSFETSGDDYTLHQETFLLDAESVGFNEYTIKVSEIEGESNYTNNRKSIYIEVIDSRSKILLLSAAPHPDLGALKNTLVQDANLEVEAALIGKQEHAFKAYDLIVWHEPGVDFDQKILNEIDAAEIPVWFILGPRTSGQILARLPLGLEARTGRQTDDVQGKFNPTFSLFEFSNEAKQLVERFPPLTINFGSLAVNKRMDVLLNQKIGPVVKKEPLFFFISEGNKKYGVTYGEGLWRWRINNFARNNDHKVFDEIVNKTVQYLMLRANTSQLRVSMPKDFSEGEKVVFGASFYNESLEPITTVPISLKLRNDAGDEFDYSFIPMGSSYTLDVGELQPGTYEWLAGAEFQNKKFDKKGSFVVKSLSLEALDTRSNFSLLNQLAENTKAKFFLLDDYDQMIQHLANRDDLVPVTYTSTAYNKLIDYKWWFLILTLLLFTEWVIRRYNGSY